MCIWFFAVCVCQATRTYSSVCASVWVCVCVTWGHVSAFCLHLLFLPLLLLLLLPLLLFFFSVGEERSVAPVRAASIHRLSYAVSPPPLTPASPFLCLCPLFLSSSLYPFFLWFILLSLPRTASVQASRGGGGGDASLGVLSSHWIVMAVILAVPGEGREEEGRREVESRWNRVRHKTEREGEENEIDRKRWENRELWKGWFRLLDMTRMLKPQDAPVQNYLQI